MLALVAVAAPFFAQVGPAEAQASGHRFEFITVGYGDFPLVQFQGDGRCAGPGQTVTVFVDIAGAPSDAISASALCGGAKATGCTASMADAPDSQHCSNSGWQTASGSPLCIRTFRGNLPLDSVWTIRCIFNSAIPI